MEKKIVAKIAQSSRDLTQFDRQIVKLREQRLKASYMRDYVTTQLVNIAEANHKFKERLFDFLAEDTESWK